MPLPGRDHTFALEDCRDLLWKLEREIDRYKKIDTEHVAAAADLTDLAFNIAVTAWHLCDWVFADMTEEQRKKLSIRKLRDLQDEARRCRALHMCRQLATGSKHWKVSEYPDPDLKVVVAATPEWRIFLEDGGTQHDAIQIFEQARDFWTSFIHQNFIAA
jgi:hypothetical protein